MEVHKPKRWRGFRGFFKEYLIIAVGVLTALGAEQVAEWLHWQHLAREHEEDLRDGVRRMMELSVEKLAAAHCTRDELLRMAVALRAPGDWKGLNPSDDKRPAAYLVPNLRTQSRPWPTDAWDAALADGALAHVPRERVANYALIYRTGRDIVTPQQDLQLTRTELTPLAFDGPITAQQRAQYIAVVAHMDSQEALAESMARTIIWRAMSTTDIRPDPAEVKRRMDTLHKNMLPGCVRDVDIEEIGKTNTITYKDGSTL